MESVAVPSVEEPHKINISHNKTVYITREKIELVDERMRKIHIMGLNYHEMCLFLDYEYEIGAIMDHYKGLGEIAESVLKENFLSGRLDTREQAALRRKLKQDLISARKKGGFIAKLSERNTFQISHIRGEIIGHLSDGNTYLDFSEKEIDQFFELKYEILECMEEFGFCLACGRK